MYNKKSAKSISPRATIYKGIKSLKPYGSLKKSDYDNYLATGKQNIDLGKALDTITASALSLCLSQVHSYVGIAVSLIGIAANVKDVLCNINPKTKYLGCKYKTYTHGAFDYKYINKFYSNVECKGEFVKKFSYEHFMVY